jgi:predicted PurR-regulated permease PerM
MKNIYTAYQSRVLIVSLTLISGIFLMYALRGLFPAILGALVFFVLFRPLNRYLTINRGWKKWIATWSIMIMSFLVIVLPFLTVGLMIGKRVSALLDEKELISETIEQVKRFIGVNLGDSGVIDKAVTFVQEHVLGGVGNLLTGVGELMLTLAIMYFLLYFLLYRSESVEKDIIKYIPFNNYQIKLFAVEIKKATNSNLLGQGFIAFVQGTLVAIGFWLFNYQDPVFWGTISFFVSFLPVIGAPLVFVPAAIIAFSSGETRNAYALLIWGFVLVTNIDNVIRYFISKYIAQTHPVITIVGVIIGIPLFGILGLVFGPLLISIFLLMLKIFEDSNRKYEKLSDVETE